MRKIIRYSACVLLVIAICVAAYVAGWLTMKYLSGTSDYVPDMPMADSCAGDTPCDVSDSVPVAARTTLENNSGIEPPSTDDPGTIMVIVLGVITAIAAVAMLILNWTMFRKEE